MALDGAPGEKQMQSSVNVDIKIIDINNKPPTFHDPEAMSVYENSPVSILFFYFLGCLTKLGKIIGFRIFQFSFYIPILKHDKMS